MNEEQIETNLAEQDFDPDSLLGEPALQPDLIPQHEDLRVNISIIYIDCSKPVILFTAKDVAVLRYCFFNGNDLAISVQDFDLKCFIDEFHMDGKSRFLCVEFSTRKQITELTDVDATYHKELFSEPCLVLKSR